MTKLRNIALASSIAGISFMSANAAAADAPASPHTFTTNVGLYSQYVFRGLTQTNEEPALQGGFDYSHSSGLYFGVWGSNVSWLKENNTTGSNAVAGTYKTGGSLELDFYGGYKGSVGDFGYDIGLLQYYYPGDVFVTSPSTPKANTLEAYIAGSWKWFTVKYSHALSNDVFANKNARGSSYLDLSASFPIGETGLTLGAHYGMQEFEGKDNRITVASHNNDNLYSYDDWKVSATYDMGKVGKTFTGVTVGVAYTDTNGNTCGYGAFNQTRTISGASCTGVYPKNIADGQTTVWISKTF